jgi:hypothetical protein
MRTFRIKRDSWTVLAGILHANESFRTAGSMRGEVNPTPYQGCMPTEEYTLMRDRHAVDPLEYAVWSYGTIIGYKWDGQWYVPDCTYSITTTIQQNKLRVAVDA